MKYYGNNILNINREVYIEGKTMSIKIDGIQSEDELKKAQAAAQAQGTTITDYNEWSEILSQFQDNGIQSTGSYTGDKALMENIQAQMAELAQQLQEQDAVQKNMPENNQTEKVQKLAETDKQQELKATVANATSSQIMSDYMKYYHMLM